MWGASIRARVNRVIKQRIKVAQQRHNEYVKKVEDNYLGEIERLAEAKVAEIEASALALVESVIGKI